MASRNLARCLQDFIREYRGAYVDRVLRQNSDIVGQHEQVVDKCHNLKTKIQKVVKWSYGWNKCLAEMNKCSEELIHILFEELRPGALETSRLEPMGNIESNEVGAPQNRCVSGQGSSARHSADVVADLCPRVLETSRLEPIGNAELNEVGTPQKSCDSLQGSSARHSADVTAELHPRVLMETSQLELTGHGELNEIRSSENSCDSKQESSAQNSNDVTTESVCSFEMSSLHLDNSSMDASLVAQTSDVDEEVNDGQGGQEREEKSNDFSLKFFTQNEKICELLQRLEELEESKELLRRNFESLMAEHKSSEEKCRRMAINVFKDLEAVCTRLGNTWICPEIASGKDSNLEEKFIVMRRSVSKIKAEIEKQKRMSDANVASLDRNITDTNERDQQNCTSANDIAEEAVNQSATTEHSPEESTHSVSEKRTKKRKIDELRVDITNKEELASKKKKLKAQFGGGKEEGCTTIFNATSLREIEDGDCMTTSAQETSSRASAPASEKSGVHSSGTANSSTRQLRRSRLRVCSDFPFPEENVSKSNTNRADGDWKTLDEKKATKPIKGIGRRKKPPVESESDNLRKTSLKRDKPEEENTLNTEIHRRPHGCTLCHKRFTNPKNIWWHMHFVHSEERPFKCKHCDQAFKTRYHLKRHEQHPTVHMNMRLFQCDRCHRSFSSKRWLSRHVHSNNH